MSTLPDMSCILRVRAVLCCAADGFDMIVDDGSHNIIHMYVSLQHLWPVIKPGGVYVVEVRGMWAASCAETGQGTPGAPAWPLPNTATSISS